MLSDRLLDLWLFVRIVPFVIRHHVDTGQGFDLGRYIGRRNDVERLTFGDWVGDLWDGRLDELSVPLMVLANDT